MRVAASEREGSAVGGRGESESRRYNRWRMGDDRTGKNAPGLAGTDRPRFAYGRAPWPYSPPRPPTLPADFPLPAISVVVPTRNGAAFLEECLLSVIHQHYGNVQLIVVDGASTDGTAAILERYAPHLAHVISEPDRGQSDAINKGMALARGELLTWLNHDDLLAPNALHILALHHRHRPADLYAGALRVIGDAEPFWHMTGCPDGSRLSPGELLDLEGHWLHGRFWYQPETFFTRDAWLRAGGHVDARLHYSMDYELWLRMAAAGAAVSVVGAELARFRRHAEQKTHDPSAFQDELRRVRRTFMAAHPGAAIQPATVSSRPPRLAFANDVGPRHGAGLAHRRLADAAAVAGCDVGVFALQDEAAESRPAAGHAAFLEHLTRFDPDLVVLGNLHGAGTGAALDLLAAVRDRHRTLQVLHDFWPVTGRCAYPGACGLYRTGCDDRCPTAGEYPALPPERIRTAWDAKQALLSRGVSPALAALSPYAASVAGSAAPAGAVIELSAGVDTSVFRPRDAAFARELLGLASDRALLLITATNLADTRKGVDRLAAALDLLPAMHIGIVTVGHGPDLRLASGIPVFPLGYIESEEELAMVYNAVDAVLGGSRDETLGQTFMEAAASGVPSVAFEAGGIGAALVDGVTGVLVRGDTPRAFADALGALLVEPGRREALGWSARLWAEGRFSLLAAAHGLSTTLATHGLITITPGLAPDPTRRAPAPVYAQASLATTSGAPRRRLGGSDTSTLRADLQRTRAELQRVYASPSYRLLEHASRLVRAIETNRRLPRHLRRIVSRAAGYLR